MGFLGSGGLRVNLVDIRGRRNSRTPLIILHLSDLHGASLGPGQCHLERILQDVDPDLLFLTGDILDEHTASIDDVQRFITVLPRVQGFFVPGNHDPVSPLYPGLGRALAGSGIVPLVNRDALFTKNGFVVRVVGLDDLYHGEPDFSLLGEAAPIADPTHGPTIVAAHSPTIGRRNLARAGGRQSLLRLAEDHGVDLVLCGHTHGGQVRLPFVGAVYVPGQRLFPKVVHGVYSAGGTSMYVTSGLGTSHLPIRLLSPPEVALIRWYP